MFLLNPLPFIRAQIDLLVLLVRQRHLVWMMARREITDRYAGQTLGLFWAIGHPLFLMGLYVFVFVVVLKTKVGGTVDMPRDYATYIISGLIPWMAFQESMAKAVGVIVANANLVKQVIFPIEVLPIKGVLAAYVPQVVSFTVLIVYVLAKTGELPWTYLLIPVLFVLQAVAMTGVSFLLSAIGVYFRDLKDFVQVFCVAGVYIMPICYLPQWVPAMVRPVLYFNPFSYLIWCYQDACYFGRIEHPWAWVVLLVGSFVTLGLGSRTFRHLKSHFGNAL